VLVITRSLKKLIGAFFDCGDGGNTIGSASAVGGGEISFNVESVSVPPLP
jgi:hypothetical protein